MRKLIQKLKKSIKQPKQSKQTQKTKLISILLAKSLMRGEYGAEK